MGLGVVMWMCRPTNKTMSHDFVSDASDITEQRRHRQLQSQKARGRRQTISPVVHLIYVKVDCMFFFVILPVPSSCKMCLWIQHLGDGALYALRDTLRRHYDELLWPAAESGHTIRESQKLDTTASTERKQLGCTHAS